MPTELELFRQQRDAAFAAMKDKNNNLETIKLNERIWKECNAQIKEIRQRDDKLNVRADDERIAKENVERDAKEATIKYERECNILDKKYEQEKELENIKHDLNSEEVDHKTAADIEVDAAKSEQERETNRQRFNQELIITCIRAGVDVAKLGVNIYLTVKGYNLTRQSLYDRMWFGMTNVMPRDVVEQVPSYLKTALNLDI